MRYLIPIHTHAAPWAALDGAEPQKWMQDYLDYVANLRKRDKFVASGQLHLSNEAKQIVNGKRSVVDGPFADTKEQVGGFFVVEAADEADAIDLAAACPGAQHGRIELRQMRQR